MKLLEAREARLQQMAQTREAKLQQMMATRSRQRAYEAPEAVVCVLLL